MAWTLCASSAASGHCILPPTTDANGDLPGTLIRNTASALEMFFWCGDGIPRHNAPYRPVFDVIVVIFFTLGLIRLIVAALGPTPPPPVATVRRSMSGSKAGSPSTPNHEQQVKST